MHKDEIKKNIEDNKELFPISYHSELVFRDEIEDENRPYIISPQNDDGVFSIVPFYKPITRF